MNTTLRALLLLLSTALAGFAWQGCHSSRAEARQTPAATGERLELTFKFQRGGIASSQYAIWIEDADGNLVRTLYATSFTAKGGYSYRPDAIPTWVRKANPKAMSEEQVDAITGATPRSGTLTYTWDGTDNAGRSVPAGHYRFFVEGTLYWDSRALYSGQVSWGGPEQRDIPIEARRENSSSTNENMISALKACHIRL